MTIEQILTRIEQTLSQRQNEQNTPNAKREM
jgi:hypothetical protein